MPDDRAEQPKQEKVPGDAAPQDERPPQGERKPPRREEDEEGRRVRPPRCRGGH